MNLEILNIASDTNNNKNIKNHTHYSKLKNSLCGDEIQIKLIIKDDKIVDLDTKEIRVFIAKHQRVYFQKFQLIKKKITLMSYVMM